MKGFKLDKAAFGREVLKADYMLDLVAETAAEVAGKAGAGYEATHKMGRKRAVSMVWADDYDAIRDDYENNTLLKAVYPLQTGPDRGRE